MINYNYFESGEFLYNNMRYKYYYCFGPKYEGLLTKIHRPIRRGNKLICTCSFLTELTENKIYTVMDSGQSTFCVINDNGERNWYSKEFLKLMTNEDYCNKVGVI